MCIQFLRKFILWLCVFSSTVVSAVDPYTQPQPTHGWEIELFSKPQYLGLGSGVLLASLMATQMGAVLSYDVQDPTMRLSILLPVFTYFSLVFREEAKGFMFSQYFPLQGIILRHKLRRFENKLNALCVGAYCKAVRVTSKAFGREDVHHAVRITYPDGWWFEVSLDPNVIEVKTKPSTRDELVKFRGRIQKDLYGVAAQVGLRALSYNAPINGGHLNLGMRSTFGEDVRLFRNFIVDFVNHTEIHDGILGKDRMNAKALAMDESSLNDFREVIEEFDREISENRDKLWDPSMMEKLAKDIQEKVYKNRGHKFALEMSKVFRQDLAMKYRRLEIRSSRSPRDVDHLLFVTDLYDGRIAFLKEKNELVPLRTTTLSPDPAEQMRVFGKYVRESGLEVESFKDYLPKKFVPHFENMGFNRLRCSAVF